MTRIHGLAVFVLGLSAIATFLGALLALLSSFRHKEPGITWSWALRTFLSAKNFTPRGRQLRKRFWLLLLAAFILNGATNIYGRYTGLLKPRVPAATASAPVEEREPID